jgi:uncharacterized membrane protein
MQLQILVIKIHTVRMEVGCMRTLRIISLVTCLVLMLSIFSAFFVPVKVSAALDESVTVAADEPLAGDKIELSCQYPALKNKAGSTFSYDIEVKYTGGEKPKYFEFKVTTPTNFVARVEKSYGGDEIPGLNIDPKAYTPEKIKLTALGFDKPGDYKIKLDAFSGALRTSIDLTAIITAKYSMELKTQSGVLNTNVTAGQEDTFPVIINNSGTADLEKVNLSSVVRGSPAGWTVTFSPDKLDTLLVKSEKEVQVKIKTPQKTISGDYEITITAKPEGKPDVEDKVNIRVTVLTPTIWGWVGVGIVVLVIIGLAVMFWRFGRR